MEEEQLQRQREAFAHEQRQQLLARPHVVDVGVVQLDAVDEVAVEERAEGDVQLGTVADDGPADDGGEAVEDVPVLDEHLAVEEEPVMDEVEVWQDGGAQDGFEVGARPRGEVFGQGQAQQVAHGKPVPLQVVVAAHDHEAVPGQHPFGQGRQKQRVPAQRQVQFPDGLEVVRPKPEGTLFPDEGGAERVRVVVEPDLPEAFCPPAEVVVGVRDDGDAHEVDHVAVEDEPRRGVPEAGAGVFEEAVEGIVGEEVFRAGVAPVVFEALGQVQVAHDDEVPAFERASHGAGFVIGRRRSARLAVQQEVGDFRIGEGQGHGPGGVRFRAGSGYRRPVGGASGSCRAGRGRRAG